MTNIPAASCLVISASISVNGHSRRQGARGRPWDPRFPCHHRRLSMVIGLEQCHLKTRRSPAVVQSNASGVGGPCHWPWTRPEVRSIAQARAGGYTAVWSQFLGTIPPRQRLLEQFQSPSRSDRLAPEKLVTLTRQSPLIPVAWLVGGRDHSPAGERHNWVRPPHGHIAHGQGRRAAMGASASLRSPAGRFWPCRINRGRGHFQP